MPASRLVIFSNKPPGELRRLLDRLWRELPDVQVCGILYQNYASRSAAQRIRAVLGRFSEPGYVLFAGREVFRRLLAYLSIPFDAVIRFLHACPRNPNPGSEVSLKDLVHLLRLQGCDLFVTPDAQSPEALAFVERQEAELGVVFNTGELSHSLVTIPRLGSIGLMEPTIADDNRCEIRVAVRKVHAPVSPVLCDATIPIEPFDDLTSLTLKAQLVGLDLVVAGIADCLAGKSPRFPVQEAEQMQPHPSPRQMALGEKKLLNRNRRYSPKLSRPAWKLVLRSIFLLPVAVIRNWFYRYRKAFPVVIFYHHVIADRPHHLGIPTAALARQIAFLRKFYRIASLEEAMQMLARGSVPVPTVVLTFDDGYADNFINLRAVAEKYNIPVFLFLSTAHMQSGSPFSHDVKHEQTDFVPLSWNQVTVLSRRGFSFGCHTRSHFDCGLGDVSRLEEEITGSKLDLASCAGIQANYFSFPWGMPENMSDQAQHLAKSSFQYVFAAAGGVNVIGKNPQGTLLRRANHPGSLWEVELSAQCLLNMKTWRDLFPGIF